MTDKAAPAMAIVDMVLPDQCNHHGTLFGGAALAMLDKLAFILGSKILRGTLVTAAVGQLDFRAPVPAGCLVDALGTVARIGRRSVDIDAQLVSEDVLSGQRTCCLTGRFTMVAIDSGASRRAAPVPDNLETDALIAEIVFPGHANHRGILHGGPAMAWLAKAGFAAATRHARQPIVMAASRQVDFLSSAHVGDVVEIAAWIAGSGRTSLTVEAEMFAETPETGERRRCTTASLVFVAIDDNGRPIPLQSIPSFPEPQDER